MICLLALLVGDFYRRGKTTRILIAITFIAALHLISISLFNLSQKTLALIPLAYFLPILTSAVLGFVMFREVNNFTQRQTEIDANTDDDL